MNRPLLIATAGGLVAQLAMVIAGHYVPFIKDNVFALGGMFISFVAGIAFAQSARAGWWATMGGGLVAGGLCAFLGIAVSVLLGDTLPIILAFGTAASAITGFVGAAVGKAAGMVIPRPPQLG